MATKATITNKDRLDEGAVAPAVTKRRWNTPKAGQRPSAAPYPKAGGSAR